MLVKTRGICLGCVKYSDSSIIVQLYTEDFGRQSYLVSGIHSKRSHAKVNLFQALFLLDIEVYHKPNSSALQRLKEARMARPLTRLPFDIRKSSQAMFIAELLHKVLQEEEASEAMFHFLFSAIELLDAVEEHASNFLLVFLFKLARHLGIEPKARSSQEEGFFDLLAASFVKDEPIHPHFLSEEDTQYMHALFQTDFLQMKLLKLNNQQRRSMLDALLLYYKVHLEIETELKSLGIMREVMQD